MNFSIFDSILDYCHKRRWHLFGASVAYVTLALIALVVAVLTVIPQVPASNNRTPLLCLVLGLFFHSITVLFIVPTTSIAPEKRTASRKTFLLFQLIIGAIISVTCFIPLIFSLIPS